MSEPIVPPVATPAPAAKPGYKTTEFWLSAVATLGGLVLASGAVSEGGSIANILGLVLSTLATLGYTGSRAAVKKAQS